MLFYGYKKNSNPNKNVSLMLVFRSQKITKREPKLMSGERSVIAGS